MTSKKKKQQAAKSIDRRQGRPTESKAWQPDKLQDAADLQTVQRAVADSEQLTPPDMLALQRTVGNQVAQRILAQRQGGVEGFELDVDTAGRVDRARSSRMTVRPAGDTLEREADAQARQATGVVPKIGAQPFEGGIPRQRISSSVVQRAWTKSGVNKVLKKDPKGIEAVKNLNAEGYEVIHYDKYEYKRQYYTDATMTVKDGPLVPFTRNGWHIRTKREIALSDQGSNDEAASTLVHEVAHAGEHKKNEEWVRAGKPGKEPFPDTLSKELDAHIKQARFNKAAKIPQKHKSFLDVHGEVDEKAIKKYVERVYAVGSKKRYYRNTKPVYKVIEKIKPWPAIP